MTVEDATATSPPPPPPPPRPREPQTATPRDDRDATEDKTGDDEHGSSNGGSTGGPTGVTVDHAGPPRQGLPSVTDVMSLLQGQGQDGAEARAKARATIRGAGDSSSGGGSGRGAPVGRAGAATGHDGDDGRGDAKPADAATAAASSSAAAASTAAAQSGEFTLLDAALPALMAAAFRHCAAGAGGHVAGRARSVAVPVSRVRRFLQELLLVTTAHAQHMADVDVRLNALPRPRVTQAQFLALVEDLAYERYAPACNDAVDHIEAHGEDVSGGGGAVYRGRLARLGPPWALCVHHLTPFLHRRGVDPANAAGGGDGEADRTGGGGGGSGVMGAGVRGMRGSAAILYLLAGLGRARCRAAAELVTLPPGSEEAWLSPRRRVATRGPSRNGDGGESGAGGGGDVSVSLHVGAGGGGRHGVTASADGDGAVRSTSDASRDGDGGDGDDGSFGGGGGGGALSLPPVTLEAAASAGTDNARVFHANRAPLRAVFAFFAAATLDGKHRAPAAAERDQRIRWPQLCLMVQEFHIVPQQVRLAVVRHVYVALARMRGGRYVGGEGGDEGVLLRDDGLDYHQWLRLLALVARAKWQWDGATASGGASGESTRSGGGPASSSHNRVGAGNDGVWQLLQLLEAMDSSGGKARMDAATRSGQGVKSFNLLPL